MQYFKGFYFKCSENNKSFAMIPALHHDGNRKNASLQIITKEQVYSIPYSDISFQRGIIRLGRNLFSEKGMSLNVDYDGCKINGKVYFKRLKKLKYDIMGPFRYIPFLQCRHSVVSMRHSVRGSIMINDTNYRFNNGVGYIEGDRGRSFPKEYIWTQCHFGNGSLMLAVADIPFMGFSFKGIIGAVVIDGREYRIATYLGARISHIGNRVVMIRQGNYKFYAKLLEETHQDLNAPINGEMIRTIHESVSCRAYYKFSYKNRDLLEFESDNASFEYEMGKEK